MLNELRALQKLLIRDAMTVTDKWVARTEEAPNAEGARVVYDKNPDNSKI